MQDHQLDPHSGSRGWTRTFVHEDDTWAVYERRSENYDRRSAMKLVFECTSAVRLVRVYPADWFALTTDELLAVSWSR